MTQESSSSFKALDLLNKSVALQHGGSTATGPTTTTKFEKVVNSLSSFLTTAGNTIITVDSLINGPGGSTAGPQTPANQSGSQQMPAAASTSIFSSGRSNIGRWALWGGLAAGGALLGYMSISANKKHTR